VSDFEQFKPTEPPTKRRRASDSQSHIEMPPDMWRLLTDMRDRGIRMENDLKGINSAFLKDEEGAPDYRGHRDEHASDRKNKVMIEAIKGDLTKKLLGALALLACSFLASGALSQVKQIFSN